MKEKQTNGKSRFLALLLSFVMVVGLLQPGAVRSVQAADDQQAQQLSEESQQGKVSLRTTLTDGMTQKGSKKTFDVWARDEQDQKRASSVYFDGEEISPNWDDNVKTSYTLDFSSKEDGDYEVRVEAVDDDGVPTILTYTIHYQKAQEGELIGYAVFSMEAFTITKGYIIEPVLAPIYEGENGAQLLDRMLKEHGFGYRYTGSLESGFYLSQIYGTNYSGNRGEAVRELDLSGAQLEENIAALIPSIASSFDPDGGTEGALGEFDYNYMSGWMYCVNTVFPNVGFADYYPSPDDVMRVQFTVGYGTEIGGSSSMGGGIADAYAVADKDQLTTLLAQINSAYNSEYLKELHSGLIEEAQEVLQNIVADQETVDDVVNRLNEAMYGTATKLESLSFVQDEVTIPMEGQENLEIVTEPEQVPFPLLLDWSSAEEQIVAVSNGTATATGAGTTRITASYGDQSAQCQVTVPENLITDIALNKTEDTILRKATTQLAVTITPANTTEDRTVTWSSSNEEVATVANGLVTGVSEGTATITATVGSFSRDCQITVQEIPMTGVSVQTEQVTVNKGKYTNLTLQFAPENTTDDRAATWSSSNESVATVSAAGRVTGVAAGTAVITAQVGRFKAYCVVTVQEIPAEQVAFRKRTASVRVGRNLTLYRDFLPSDQTDGTEAIFSSSDTNIATVNSNGMVSGVSEGLVVITVKSKVRDIQDQCLVRVVSSNSYNTSRVTLEQSEVTLCPGNQTELTVTLSPTNATDPVIYKSSDEEVAEVDESGIVTAKSAGTANITAYAGDKSAICTVTVEEPLLDELSLYQSAYGTPAAYELEPEFTPGITAYEAKALDVNSALAVKASLRDGLEGAITAKWTDYNGTERTAAITSDASSAANIALFMSSGVQGNTLTLEVTSGELTQEYVIQVNRVTTLSSLKVSENGRALELAPAFDRQVQDYTVEVTDTTKQLTLTAMPSTGLAQVQINGIPVEEDGTFAVNLKKTETLLQIQALADGAEAYSYTVTIKKVPSVTVKLQTEPEDATVFLRDSQGGRISSEDGAYHLLPGTVYQYTVSKTGYISQTGQLVASEDEEKEITLEEAPKSAFKDLPSDWSGFRNLDTNMGITSAETPDSQSHAKLLWATKIGQGWGGSAVSSPILVDGYLICSQATRLLKVDVATGEIVAEGTMVGSSPFSIVPPTYAKGMIFVGLSGGRIQAFDASTLESLWVYTDALGGQPNTPIKYSDGYIYTGFWNSETKDANMTCLSVTDENPQDSQEAKAATWTYAVPGGFYWAGAYVTKDYVVVGTDDGTSSSNSDTACLYVFQKTTGEVIDRMTGFVGDIRSDVSYDADTDRMYFTSKGGYLYSIKMGGDGSLLRSSLTSLALGGMSTSTPVVYKGRAYLGVSGASQFGGTGHVLEVVDIAEDGKMTLAYAAPAVGYPQTSGLLSTAYEETDGYVTVYFTYNNKPGGIQMLKDSPGQTEAISEEIFIPERDMSQYCICSLIADSNGTFYYKNDSGYMMAVGANQEILLQEALESAGKELDAYKNPEEYRQQEADQLEQIKQEYLEKIEAAASREEVAEIVKEAKAAMDAVKTAQQAQAEELQNAKTDAKEELTGYKALEDYRAAEQSRLKEILAQASEAIDNAKTQEEVAQLKENYKGQLDEIKTDEELTAQEEAKALEEKKQQVSEQLTTYKDSEAYRPEQQDQLKTILESALKAVSEAKTQEEVEQAKREAQASLDAVQTDEELTAQELAQAKSQAAQELDAYKDLEAYRPTQQQSLQMILGAAKGYLAGAADVSKVGTILTQAKTAMDAVRTDEELTAEELTQAKEKALSEIEDYKDADAYRETEKQSVLSLKEQGKAAVEAAKTAEEVAKVLTDTKAALDEIKNDAQLSQEELATVKELAQTEIRTYKNAADYRNAEQVKLLQLVERGCLAVRLSANAESIEQAVELTKGSLDLLKTEKQYLAEEQGAVQNPNGEETSAAESVLLQKAKKTMKKGKTFALKATVTPAAAKTTLKWSSSKPAVASVDQNGRVTAKKAGKTVITVTTDNGKTYSCTITVKKQAAEKITLNVKKKTLKKGKTFTLKAALKPSYSTDSIKWSSSDKKVATVTAKGVVKARKKGTAVIKAKTSSKKQVTCIIRVK